MERPPHQAGGPASRDDGGRRASYWNCRDPSSRSSYRSSNNSTSSSSGTISTTYTSSTSSSSSASSHLFSLYMELDADECRQERERNIVILVQELFGGIKGSDGRDRTTTVLDVLLERWFTELGVDWALHLGDDGSSSSGGRELGRTSAAARSWIRAFNEIMKSIVLVSSLVFPDLHRRSAAAMGGGLPCIPEEYLEREPADAAADDDDHEFQFALFIQESVLKMLVFVDTIIADDDPDTTTHDAGDDGMAALYQKLNTVLRVRGALSDTLPEMEVLFLSTPSTLVTARIHSEVVSLLSAKLGKVTDAIWATMEQIWARIMDAMDDSSRTTLQATPNSQSADIHKVTRSVTSHIRYLWDIYWSVTPNVFQVASQSMSKYITAEIEDGNTNNPLASLTVQLLSCLQENLVKMSSQSSFPDHHQSLRFLFLINNSCYVLQRLHTTYRIFLPSSFLHLYFTALARQIDDQIQTYLQVSWAHVLSCLSNNPIPRFFGKDHYPLHKFESEFQKTYTTQKLWKVPDPQLRRRLRRAITDKIIPDYTKYIHDNDKVTVPKFTPQKLKEMLQELFEG